MDAFGFAGLVVVQDKLGFLDQDRVPMFIVGIGYPANAADDLLRGNAVGGFGVNADKA